MLKRHLFWIYRFWIPKSPKSFLSVKHTPLSESILFSYVHHIAKRTLTNTWKVIFHALGTRIWVMVFLPFLAEYWYNTTPHHTTFYCWLLSLWGLNDHPHQFGLMDSMACSTWELTTWLEHKKPIQIRNTKAANKTEDGQEAFIHRI